MLDKCLTVAVAHAAPDASSQTLTCMLLWLIGLAKRAESNPACGHDQRMLPGVLSNVRTLSAHQGLLVQEAALQDISKGPGVVPHDPAGWTPIEVGPYHVSRAAWMRAPPRT